MNDISIIPYEAQYQPDFKRLNVEWISRYFVVEPHDLEQLDQPETFILPNGGQIFLARRVHTGPADAIVGTIAMISDGPARDSYELAKMAVSPTAQRQGIARRLGEWALAFAREAGASRVWLESNRVLSPAITLYKQLGFREVPGRQTPYSRANIWMEIDL